MPRQYSPKFRQRALLLLDTMIEASEVSEFEAIKSVAGKLNISESRFVGGGARPRSMLANGPVRRVQSMPRSASASESSANYAEPMRS